MIWLYITLLAVIFQTFRNSLQKHLKGKLDTISVSWARILFLLPILIPALYYLYQNYNSVFIEFRAEFYIFCFTAGVAQIIGTLFLVELFSLRNFSVGVVYMKTDTIQVAILAFLILGESLSYYAIFAILLGVIGILLIAPFQAKLFSLKNIFHKSALFGIGVGLFFSITTIFMKKAMSLVNTESKLLPAIIVFVIYVIMQNVIYVIYTSYKKKLFLTVVGMMKEYKKCLAISLFSMFGTLCWLLAFFLQNVAYVKAVAQIEILISLLISHRIFKEEQKVAELIGILLLMLSIIILVMS